MDEPECSSNPTPASPHISDTPDIPPVRTPIPPHILAKLELPSISEIEPGLFIGNSKTTSDNKTLKEYQINAVISLVSGPLVLWRRTRFTDSVTLGRHLWIECLDSSTQDLLVHMDRACDFLDQMILPVKRPRSPTSSPQSNPEVITDERTIQQDVGAQTDDKSIYQQGEEASSDANTSPPATSNVLVHCEQGISRSATIMVAYLMRKQRRSRDEVLAEVRSKRSQVKPSANFMRQLEVWGQVDYQLWEDEAKQGPKEPYKAFLERRAIELKNKGLTGNERCFPTNLFDLSRTAVSTDKNGEVGPVK
ncbi:MAG: hypothetical protein M1833_000103 [Piccolia ochrophora]|nr:MAG: hypothetical protein M1833_000103 [Piccolia ochrophora]